MNAHNVIPISSEQSVNAAWEAYAEMARRISDDSTLLFDRPFNEELARRHERWKRLFMLQEAS